MVEGRDNTFYTGITNNLRRRIREHNGLGWWPGAKYVSNRRPVFFVHIEKFNTRKEAMHRESEIKGWSQAKKKDLIDSTSKDKILSAI